MSTTAPPPPISFRVPPEYEVVFDAAALVRGVSRSQLIRDAVLAASLEIIGVAEARARQGAGRRRDPDNQEPNRDDDVGRLDKILSGTLSVLRELPTKGYTREAFGHVRGALLDIEKVLEGTGS